MAPEEGPSLAAVFFTDLVGSTALRARLGEERADELRAIHDGLLTERIEAHGGRVLKSTGDGLMAAFVSTSDALSAAVESQQALDRYGRRPEAIAVLPVRMGLSVGDVSWAGGDCFGTPVVEAARLEAEAQGGQILCSEFVRVMARGRGGHEFRDLGFLQLKGLPEPLATCEVVWAPLAEPEPLPLPPELAAEERRRFVSRGPELELAEALLADPTRERLAVLWLLGEPGIGKTRLATEIARRAHGAGALVLFGRCNEDLPVPYQPFLEALRFFIEHRRDDELAERLGASPGELTRLVPELSDRVAGLEPTASTSAEIEQHRLFAAIRSWLAAAAGGERPVVMVLDDLQWAARPTLALLGHVARSAEPSRALLVCTARNTSPDDNEDFAALAEELERRGTPSVRVELGGLGIDDVGELIASAAGRPLDQRLRTLAAQLQEETAGNPLFLDALLASLPADPAWHSGELPRSVAETVRRRVGHLPAEVADLLRIASVAGLDFDLRVAARAAGRDELATLDALETAARAGLVLEAGADRYRFTHALVRSALAEELSRSRRVRVHLAIAEAMEAVCGNKVDEQVAALAHHFFEAVPVAGAAKAYRYALLAAERAARLLAHDEAAAAYGHALELLDDGDVAEPLARCELLLALGHVQLKAGEFRSALSTLRAAAEEAAAQCAAEHQVRAALAFEDASWRPGFHGAEPLALLRRAEAVLPDGDSVLRALTLAGLSRSLEYSGQHSEGIVVGEEAEAMARRLDDAATLVHVLDATGLAYLGVEDAPVLRVRSQELMALAAHLEDDEMRVMAAGRFVSSCMALGDLVGFDELLPPLARFQEDSRQPWLRFFVLTVRHFRAFVAGELDGAEQTLEEAHDVARALEFDEEGVYGVGMFLLRREQGRLAEVAPALRLLVRLDPGGGRWQPGLAALYAEMGMLDEARPVFERLATDGFAALPRDSTRLLCLGLVAEVCCALGDADRAAWLLEEIRPCQGMILAFTGTCACLGPADRLLGMLAATTGRRSEATAFFDAALELSHRMGSPVFVAHCLSDYAAFLRSTDAARAADMLAEAAHICEGHGLLGLGRRMPGGLMVDDGV